MSKRKQKAEAQAHYDRLAEEFGHARRGYRSIDERGGADERLLTQPLALFIFSLAIFFFLCGVQAWRAGIFYGMFWNKSAQIEKGSKRWMMNGRARQGDYARSGHYDEWGGDYPQDDEETPAPKQ